MKKRGMTEQEASAYADGLANKVRWVEMQRKREKYVDAKVELKERAEKTKGVADER